MQCALLCKKAPICEKSFCLHPILCWGINSLTIWWFFATWIYVVFSDRLLVSGGNMTSPTKMREHNNTIWVWSSQGMQRCFCLPSSLHFPFFPSSLLPFFSFILTFFHSSSFLLLPSFLFFFFSFPACLSSGLIHRLEYTRIRYSPSPDLLWLWIMLLPPHSLSTLMHR